MSRRDLIELERTGVFGRSNTNIEILEQSDGSKVAVRKIKHKPLTEDEILKALHHENVIKLLKVEWVDGVKSLTFEYCERKLKEYCVPNNAPLPPNTEREIMLQIAVGLQYIHSRNIVHANVTIENILLTKDNQVKITGFEFSKASDHDGSFLFDYRFRGSDAFLAPEIMQWLYDMEKNVSFSNCDNVSKKLTNKIDIFSAGCTFFVFLTKGTHPFGQTIVTIPTNILEGKQVYAKALKQDHYACEMVQAMLHRTPESRVNLDVVIDWLNSVPNIQPSQSTKWGEMWFDKYLPTSKDMTYDNKTKLGFKDKRDRIKGQVFAGMLFGKPVAVKRILRSEIPKAPLIPFETLLKLKHQNVLRILNIKKDDDFVYLGLEICAASLSDYYRQLYQGPFPSKREALMQLTEGLAYIHSLQLVHGCIRPANVLISTEPFIHLKLSEFGLRHSLVTMSTSSGDGKFSKECYLAPELLRKLEKDATGTVIDCPDALCDVFALGCIFYTILTNGAHPFHEPGNSIFSISRNIAKGHAFMQELSNELPEKVLVTAMIQDRGARSNLDQTRHGLLLLGD